MESTNDIRCGAQGSLRQIIYRTTSETLPQEPLDHSPYAVRSPNQLTFPEVWQQPLWKSRPFGQNRKYSYLNCLEELTPAEAIPGFLAEAPSVLSLTHPFCGGYQRLSRNEGSFTS
ncbi:hypothetical protein CDL15_Pgr002354 [Punica granatum]|uniref:Uncharacterized protein n=1 Tax=Punica granatum TaxID=22663 RepID=A0A218XU72_PUNGR|nr:hypothetical protein CDL15_Pgr002354 [Punica granatum]